MWYTAISTLLQFCPAPPALPPQGFLEVYSQPGTAHNHTIAQHELLTRFTNIRPALSLTPPQLILPEL
jgi:hypothetical protein